MKNILKITIMLLFTVLMNSMLLGQLTKITELNMHSEADIYEDANGTMYSTLVTFKFMHKMVNLPIGEVSVDENLILFTEFKQLLNDLRKEFGDFSIIKAIANAQWGETLKIW